MGSRKKAPTPINLKELLGNPCLDGVEGIFDRSRRPSEAGAPQLSTLVTTLPPSDIKPEINNLIEPLRSELLPSLSLGGDSLHETEPTRPEHPCHPNPEDGPVGSESHPSSPTAQLEYEQVRSEQARSEQVRGQLVRSDSLLSVTPVTEVPGVGRRRYYRCQTVQDAHTAGEDKLFNTMRRMAKSGQYGNLYEDGSWVVTASMDEIGRVAAMHRTNVRNNLTGLIAKLSVEQIADRNPKSIAPRRYRGFGYRQILERRRAAGLEWVVKNRGVIFVSGDEVAKALRSEALRSHLMEYAESVRSDSLPEYGSESLQSLRTDSLPVSLLGSSFQGSKKQPSSFIALALQKTIGHSDDDAVCRIVTGCRQICPDAAEDEIVRFIQDHGTRFVRMKNVDNPMGMLIWQVQKSFPADLQRYRQAEQQRKEAQAAQEAELRRQWQHILDDPKAAEEDKQWARQLLGQEQ
jgi:hypothetical protein